LLLSLSRTRKSIKMKSPKIKRRSRKKHLLRKRNMRKEQLILKDQRR
jgi:hypothetical protein